MQNTYYLKAVLLGLRYNVVNSAKEEEEQCLKHNNSSDCFFSGIDGDDICLNNLRWFLGKLPLFYWNHSGHSGITL